MQEGLCLLLTVVVASSIAINAVDVECTDLTPYVRDSDVEVLNIMTGGGDIPDNIAVYFELPAQLVPGSNTTYCLKDNTIPASVGANKCTSSQKCWLTVGRHQLPQGGDGGSNRSNVECLCSGSTMSHLWDDDETHVSQGCGFDNVHSWALACNDAWNNPGNSSDVYVSRCPKLVLGCPVCYEGGAMMPSFVVGVQWISNLDEQCFDNPFPTNFLEEDCSTRLLTSSIIGVSLGVALFVASVGGLAYHYRTQRSARVVLTMPSVTTQKAGMEDAHQKFDEEVPMEEISITTDESAAK